MNTPLTHLRRQLGMSQAQAAAYLGTTQATYSRWEAALAGKGPQRLVGGAFRAIYELRLLGRERHGAGWSDDWLIQSGQAGPLQSGQKPYASDPDAGSERSLYAVPDGRGSPPSA